MTAVALDDQDPVTQLAQWLALIDNTSRDTNVKLRRNEKNRLGLLLVHGCAALTIAPGFAIQLSSPGGMDAPSYQILRLIPGVPYSLAFILGLGGAILIPATIARARGWETLGLVLLATWYATMSITLYAAFIPWAYAGGDMHTRPSLFGGQLYTHFLVVMLVHLYTLAKMRRRESP